MGLRVGSVKDKVIVVRTVTLNMVLQTWCWMMLPNNILLTHFGANLLWDICDDGSMNKMVLYCRYVATRIL